jgi:hypothetical protein
MTDEQIIKALEYCSTDIRGNTCPKCAFYKKHRCSTLMLNAASDIINRQKVKIKSLKQIINEQDKEVLKLQNRIIFWRKNLNYQPEKIKSEAIKEFAERLKKEVLIDSGFEVLQVGTIDDLVKEMTEEEK